MKILLALCLSLAASTVVVAAPAPETPSAARFEIDVTKHGFEPANLKVPAGKQITLVFDRKTDNTCIKEVVITRADGTKIDEKLPLNKPIEVTTSFAKAGTLTYACAMGMMHGILVVQ